jgi:cGMP-dependent protein kinase
MDLFDVIRRLHLLKECDAKFYIGCIVGIIEHLHERDIVYSDLKPENIVVDAQGYPKLIDFGTAKVINGRTYTIVGTPHYMAPEIVTGQGYGLSADYWAIGIMLYEFLYGYVPFGEDENDPYNIYEKVQEHRLIFPQWIDNKNKVKEFISQLLSKNPASRLRGSFEKLKSHQWFIGLNWDKITSKELKAPFIPKIANLDIDIDNAFRNESTFDDVISRIENSEEIVKIIRKDTPPLGWDEDF